MKEKSKGLRPELAASIEKKLFDYKVAFKVKRVNCQVTLFYGGPNTGKTTVATALRIANKDLVFFDVATTSHFLDIIAAFEKKVSGYTELILITNDIEVAHVIDFYFSNIAFTDSIQVDF